MGYMITIESKAQQKLLNLTGTVSEEEWAKRQKVAEDKFQARTVKHTMMRVKGSWKEREATT